MEENYGVPKWRKNTPLSIDKDTHDYMKSQIHNLIHLFVAPHIHIRLGYWISRPETASELCTRLESTIFNFLMELRQRWKNEQASAGNLPLGEMLPKRSK